MNIEKEKYFYKNIEEIKKILFFAVNNKYSDFYKNKYQQLDFDISKIRTYEDFTKIPFLEKEEVLSTLIKKRHFVAKNYVGAYNFSSGTTSQNKPLVIPRLKSKLTKEKYSSLGAIDNLKNKKILILFPPMAAAFTAFFEQLIKREAIPILGDTSNLLKTALISKEVKIGGIITTPTILSFFIDALKEAGGSFDEIDLISLGGEMTTTARYETFRSTFPKANFIFRYGASEAAGLIGYQCKYLADGSQKKYHPASRFIEIIKTNKESSGELIVTDLIAPKAFPLIRYKTGDNAQLVSEKCKCGQKEVIITGGRSGCDTLRFSGVIIYAEMIEKSLKGLEEYINPGFQMHVHEIKLGDRVMPRLVLYLRKKNDVKETMLMKEIITEHVSQNLLLSPTRSLKFFSDNHLFNPLEVIFSEKISSPQEKTRSIISHLE